MKFKKGDIIIFVILACGIFGLIINSIFMKKVENKKLFLEVDGKVFKEYKLNGIPQEKRQTITIPSNQKDLQRQFTIVMDQDGAYVETVVCPDQVCVKMGKVTQPGKVIVCLPNKFTMYIKGDTNDNTIDGVTN